MEGVRIFAPTKALTATIEKVNLKLITSHPGFEIMQQDIPLGASAWVAPAEDSGVCEFFFITEGEIMLTFDDGTTQNLVEGDSFEARGLKQDLMITPVRPCKVLYFTNSPMFESLFGYSSDYHAILRSIDEKDKRTLYHCKNVVRLSSLLAKKLLGGYQIGYEDLVNAASFHDVGVCLLPDDVVSSTTVFTGAERSIMQRHPVTGSNMLTKFSTKVRYIVLCHHERIDGSGYPNGLSGNRIPIEAQIIGIADSFEAMVSHRPYKQAKSFKQAAEELASMPKRYNKDITSVLVKLVEDGTIDDSVIEPY